jgi:AcrR family transcriptional regulator
VARPQQISDDDIDIAARSVFLRDGPQAPISLVAKRLGVSSAAVFQRVGTKRDLLRRALGPGVPETAAALLAGPARRARAATVASLRRELAGHLAGLLLFLDRTLPSLIALRVAGVDFAKRAHVDGLVPPLYLRRCVSTWLMRAPSLGVGRRLASILAEALLSSLESRALHRHLGGASFVDGDDDAVFIHALLVGLLPRRMS